MRSVMFIIISGIIGYTFYSYSTRSSADNSSDRRMIIAPGSSCAITADINDADDPTRLVGIDIMVGEDVPPEGDITLMASSSNTRVVSDANLTFSGTGDIRNLKITPIAPGYTTITIKVKDGPHQRFYTVEYAASQTKNMKTKRWHGGIADASAAISIDDNYMLVANDESNYFYLYNRNHSGPPIKTFDFNQGNKLNLEDTSAGLWKEVDVEAGVRSIKDPPIIYWIGSMSNNSTFFNKANRNRLFAISVSGKGNATNITNQGYYSNLRQNLITWGDAHGYDFKNSAAVGKDAKGIDGFNIEGIVFGPDNKTLYIGFRAPLVPMGLRTKAVIAPIHNFEAWFNKGYPSGDPVIGSPIELDLGGRGIRDIIRLSNNNYVIIAGSCGIELTPAAYTWTGHASDAPVMITSFELAGLNVEGVMPVCEGCHDQNKLQVLTDNGNDIFYCDTLCAKELLDDRFKKFSSVIFPLVYKK